MVTYCIARQERERVQKVYPNFSNHVRRPRLPAVFQGMVTLGRPVLDLCETDGGSTTDTGRTSEGRRSLPLGGVSMNRPNHSGKQAADRSSSTREPNSPPKTMSVKSLSRWIIPAIQKTQGETRQLSMLKT